MALRERDREPLEDLRPLSARSDEHLRGPELLWGSIVVDPYETRHGPKYYAAEQEAALDALGFDWTWWLDRVMEQAIEEMEDEA